MSKPLRAGVFCFWCPHVSTSRRDFATEFLIAVPRLELGHDAGFLANRRTSPTSHAKNSARASVGASYVVPPIIAQRGACPTRTGRPMQNLSLTLRNRQEIRCVCVRSASTRPPVARLAPPVPPRLHPHGAARDPGWSLPADGRLRGFRRYPRLGFGPSQSTPSPICESSAFAGMGLGIRRGIW